MTEPQNNTLPLTRIQKLIGSLMLKSKHEVPCCYLESAADVTALVKCKKQYCKAAGIRVTTNDFFFYAIGRAIRELPRMAGTLNQAGDKIKIAEHYGVGFAVAAPQGLVVPVLKDMGQKSLPRIAAESADFLNKARSNHLMPDDFDGANVVMSSLGMYGIQKFFAIAPPGATGIISLGRPTYEIVPFEGSIAKRKMMSIALAVDQTIINEIYAAKFLQKVIQRLEDPESMTS